MKILLSDEEINLLAAESIDFDRSKDYTEQDAFELLEKIYDAEIMYSNYPPDDMRAIATADEYAHLADKVHQSKQIRTISSKLEMGSDFAISSGSFRPLSIKEESVKEEGKEGPLASEKMKKRKSAYSSCMMMQFEKCDSRSKTRSHYHRAML